VITYISGNVFDDEGRINSLMVEKPQVNEKYILDYTYNPEPPTHGFSGRMSIYNSSIYNELERVFFVKMRLTSG